MKKINELADGNSTLSKADQQEPLFILRAQDFSSPKVILHWIAKNFETAPEAKIQEAFDIAIEMKNYHSRKPAD